jgi:hypothetical protein
LANSTEAQQTVALLSCVLAAAVTQGCVTEQRYHVVGELVQLTADAQPAYVTEDDDPVYRVDAPFTLRISAPSEQASTRLSSAPAETRAPFPRLPWVALHDLGLQVDYALTNASDNDLSALITLNGINEFHYYAPGPENFHQWERRVALGPRQRVTGIVTELELDELAIDLATVVNGPLNSNLIVDRRSQSSLDPRAQPFIPQVIPGLVGVRAGLETTVAENLTLELTIRVKDFADRAAKRGEGSWELPEPQAFVPIVPDLD